MSKFSIFGCPIQSRQSKQFKPSKHSKRARSSADEATVEQLESKDLIVFEDNQWHLPEADGDDCSDDDGGDGDGDDDNSDTGAADAEAKSEGNSGGADGAEQDDDDDGDDDGGWGQQSDWFKNDSRADADEPLSKQECKQSPLSLVPNACVERKQGDDTASPHTVALSATRGDSKRGTDQTDGGATLAASAPTCKPRVPTLVQLMPAPSPQSDDVATGWRNKAYGKEYLLFKFDSTYDSTKKCERPPADRAKCLRASLKVAKNQWPAETRIVCATIGYPKGRPGALPFVLFRDADAMAKFMISLKPADRCYDIQVPDDLPVSARFDYDRDAKQRAGDSQTGVRELFLAGLVAYRAFLEWFYTHGAGATCPGAAAFAAKLTGAAGLQFLIQGTAMYSTNYRSWKDPEGKVKDKDSGHQYVLCIVYASRAHCAAVHAEYNAYIMRTLNAEWPDDAANWYQPPASVCDACTLLYKPDLLQGQPSIIDFSVDAPRHHLRLPLNGKGPCPKAQFYALLAGGQDGSAPTGSFDPGSDYDAFRLAVPHAGYTLLPPDRRLFVPTPDDQTATSSDADMAENSTDSKAREDLLAMDKVYESRMLAAAYSMLPTAWAKQFDLNKVTHRESSSSVYRLPRRKSGTCDICQRKHDRRALMMQLGADATLRVGCERLGSESKRGKSAIWKQIGTLPAFSNVETRKAQAEFLDRTRFEEFDLGQLRDRVHTLPELFFTVHTVLYINRFLAVMPLDKAVYLEKVVLEVDGAPRVEYRERSLQEMRNAWANRNVIVRFPKKPGAGDDEPAGGNSGDGTAERSINVLEVWLKHPQRLTFKHKVFSAAADWQRKYPDAFNVFEPSPIMLHPRLDMTKGELEASIRPALSYLEEIVANGEPTHIAWWRLFIAVFYQRPELSVPVLAVLMGMTGSGKTTMAEIFFKNVLGNRLFVLTNMEEVLGRFNGRIFGRAIFALIDDHKSCTSEQLAEFNCIITASQYRVKDEYEVPWSRDMTEAPIRWMVTAEQNPFARHPMNRRPMLEYVNTKYGGFKTDESARYFAPVRAVSALHIYQYFRYHVDTAGADLAKMPAQAPQQLIADRRAAFSLAETFVETMLTRGELPATGPALGRQTWRLCEKQRTLVPGQLLYQRYLHFAHARNEDTKFKQYIHRRGAEFKREVTRLLGEGVFVKDLRMSALNKKRAISLPSLEDGRAQFRRATMLPGLTFADDDDEDE